jgi:hypothetical protein
MRKLLSVTILLLYAAATYAQSVVIQGVDEKTSAKFVQIGLGANRGSMRDFATSPLTYKGLLANYSLGYIKMTPKREVKLSGRFNHGAYRSKRDEFFPVNSKSSQYMMFIDYARLYTINRWSDKKWAFKAGGTFNTMFDVRVNESLMNAGVGYEMFNTFFLSAKAIRTFQRYADKEKKFLFIKYKRKPRTQQLSYQLNVPVMNNTLRNGFAYIGNEGLNTIPLFKEYEYKAFSGFRLSSELSYTVVTHSSNMWRISYLWDAYAVGKEHRRFEAANHILEFSLLYRIK